MRAQFSTKTAAASRRKKSAKNGGSNRQLRSAAGSFARMRRYFSRISTDSTLQKIDATLATDTRDLAMTAISQNKPGTPHASGVISSSLIIINNAKRVIILRSACFFSNHGRNINISSVLEFARTVVRIELVLNGLTLQKTRELVSTRSFIIRSKCESSLESVVGFFFFGH